MEKYLENYKTWLAADALSNEERNELLSIADDENEIKFRFSSGLTFGTAGLRGVIGAGTNRMNVYTVNQATQGLADYLNETFENPSVAIAYDSRIKSKEFAESAALITVRSLSR